MSVNKVILVGNLGKKPELRNTNNGTPVCEFTLATNERRRDSNGESQERTEWHRIIVWGKQGESAAKYLDKGRQVYIEGRIQTREWEDRDGNKRRTTEIVASTVQFLGGGDGQRRESGSQGPPRSQGSQGGGSFGDGEIPF